MSNTTHRTAGEHREQRVKSVDDFTSFKLTRSTENFIYFEIIPIVPSRFSTR